MSLVSSGLPGRCNNRYSLSLVYRDLQSYSKAKTSIEPVTIFRGHTSVVGVGPNPTSMYKS